MRGRTALPTGLNINDNSFRFLSSRIKMVSINRKSLHVRMDLWKKGGEKELLYAQTREQTWKDFWDPIVYFNLRTLCLFFTPLLLFSIFYKHPLSRLISNSFRSNYKHAYPKTCLLINFTVGPLLWPASPTHPVASPFALYCL